MSRFSDADEQWMKRAIELAKRAQLEGEVPVGAVLVKDGEVLGEGYNAPISTCDATAHAEMRAIKQACNKVGNYRLSESSIYLTLEPCSMCAGAIVHARIRRVVIAAAEPRAGAAGSVLNILDCEQLNHRCEVEFGLQQEESSELLKTFFAKRR